MCSETHHPTVSLPCGPVITLWRPLTHILPYGVNCRVREAYSSILTLEDTSICQGVKTKAESF